MRKRLSPPPPLPTNEPAEKRPSLETFERCFIQKSIKRSIIIIIIERERKKEKRDYRTISNDIKEKKRKEKRRNVKIYRLSNRRVETSDEEYKLNIYISFLRVVGRSWKDGAGNIRTYGRGFRRKME